MRAHLSFLVNMRYITKISSYVMTLTTGKKISVPKARYAQVKREYMLYKGEERIKNCGTYGTKSEKSYCRLSGPGRNL